MPKENKAARMLLYIRLKNFIEETGANAKDIVKKASELSADYPAYGKAHEIDFRDLTPLFERLFAFDNKHYFIYKAISNPNKIGYLSRKQYTALERMKKHLQQKGISGSNFSMSVKRFLEAKGTMASPYKLLKRAFKENRENTKFLSRFFKLADDGVTTLNEDKLIQLCDVMMQLNNGIEIQDATVQECYDLDFHGSDINGSSRRCATNSCMHGKKVGTFYDAFGVHGKMIYHNGQPVGRFLLWDLPDGKKYIDRLYVRGEYMSEALAEIDEKYPDGGEYYKYPYLRENVSAPRYFIELTHPELFANKKAASPYIDTFAYLYKDSVTGKYFLSNRCRRDTENNYIYISEIRLVTNKAYMSSCPFCGQTYWSGDKNAGLNSINSTRHKLYCKGYNPRNKELKEYLEIFRKKMPLIQEEGAKNETIKLILEV